MLHQQASMGGAIRDCSRKSDSAGTGGFSEAVSSISILLALLVVRVASWKQKQGAEKVHQYSNQHTISLKQPKLAQAKTLIAGPFRTGDSSQKIELEKGTSILKIAYQDTSRKLVLPVILKISSDYQLTRQGQKQFNQQWSRLRKNG